VVFDLPVDAASTLKTESLWAEPLGESHYRLRSVPFFVFGFNEQDVILAREDSGKLLVTGVATRGGHSTYRLVLPEDTNEEQFVYDWIPLKELGCTYERATRRFVAIDVPPAADIHAVYQMLEDGESSGRWEFEEGHCGHLVRKSGSELNE